ncbi:MAG: formamidopyrimidine-DNA glycosylase, partial [Gammaproteobacteria bacterium]|nr:formamidopyrimidine-DNA glycosylase [Gammaproteobacteria bacterium]
RRASLYVVSSRELPQHDPGGLEVLDTSFEQFADRLRQRNHTLKRSLTDPRIFSGIGNAYSDEILHHARLSPFAQSKKLSDQQVRQLHQSVVHVLQAWISRLRLDSGERFPRRITAFRDGMAVHGRYGKPCPDCDATVQRIRYAGSETNYCPGCQTGGRILADRSLSRLLKDDWPRTVDELEKIRPRDK